MKTFYSKLFAVCLFALMSAFQVTVAGELAVDGYHNMAEASNTVVAMKTDVNVATDAKVDPSNYLCSNSAGSADTLKCDSNAKYTDNTFAAAVSPERLFRNLRMPGEKADNSALSVTASLVQPGDWRTLRQ